MRICVLTYLLPALQLLLNQEWVCQLWSRSRNRIVGMISRINHPTILDHHRYPLSVPYVCERISPNNDKVSQLASSNRAEFFAFAEKLGVVASGHADGLHRSKTCIDQEQQLSLQAQPWD